MIIVGYDTPAAATEPLTEDQVHDLVDEFTDAAGVDRPSLYFQPWVDGTDPIVSTHHDPSGIRTKIVVAKPVLGDLSPAAWRHLLADQVGYLRARRGRLSRRADSIRDHLDSIAIAVLLVVVAWSFLRAPSTGVLAVGIGVACAAKLTAWSWFVLEGFRAGWYAVQLAGTDHTTVNELAAYLERGRPGLVALLGYWHLHQAVEHRDRLVRGFHTVFPSTPEQPTSASTTSPGEGLS